MEKLAAGSTLPAGSAVTATGNTANANSAARKTAEVVSAPLLQLRFQLTLDPYFQIMKKWASVFKTLKVVDSDSLASAKVYPYSAISDESFSFAVLDEQIIMVHGAFYSSSYLQILLSFHMDISSYTVREGHQQGGKTRMDIKIYVH